MHTHTHTPHYISHREQEGVVAAPLEVPHGFEQRHMVPPSLGVEGLKVPRQDELVVLPVGQRSDRTEHGGRGGHSVQSWTQTRKPRTHLEIWKYIHFFIEVVHNYCNLDRNKWMCLIAEWLQLHSCPFNILFFFFLLLHCFFLAWLPIVVHKPIHSQQLQTKQISPSAG